ncbi:MAG TPA: tetratricopeptide repeat protein [Candidatus Polarisedimenticolia bacterium]|nr:tetratricopeptide repeat protein [Candidatus Polarisedimenticolia bacterium]
MADQPASESPRIAELRRRLQKEPSARLLAELAREYHETGLFEEAARVGARAVKEQPSYVSARVLLGRIYFDMGRLEEARDQMEAVLSQAPDNLVARRIVADVCWELGDARGALDRFRALLAFNPADADTRRKIERIEQELASRPEGGAAGGDAETMQPEGNGKEAAIDPGVLATPTLAEIYLQQGLVERAADVYREILKGDPANPEAVARLRELEAARPRPEDPARAALRRKIDALGRWLGAIRSGARG